MPTSPRWGREGCKKCHLRVLRRDFLGVYFGIGGDDFVPPLHLVDLKRSEKRDETRASSRSVCRRGARRRTDLGLTFSKWTVTTLPSSMSHELSSTLTSLKSWPSSMGGWPFRPTLSERRWTSTTTSLPLMRKLTSKGTEICEGGEEEALFIYLCFFFWGGGGISNRGDICSEKKSCLKGWMQTGQV